MAYNPYENVLRRYQRAAPSSDIQVPVYPQPAPLVGLPLYSGPELPQWQPMPTDDSNEQMQDAGAGIAELIKRFKKPKNPSAPAHRPNIPHGGTGEGVGPTGHGEY